MGLGEHQVQLGVRGDAVLHPHQGAPGLLDARGGHVGPGHHQPAGQVGPAQRHQQRHHAAVRKAHQRGLFQPLLPDEGGHVLGHLPVGEGGHRVALAVGAAVQRVDGVGPGQVPDGHVEDGVVLAVAVQQNHRAAAALLMIKKL